MRADVAAFGVGDARVDRAGRGLGRPRLRDAVLDGELPIRRVAEGEVGGVGREGLVGQARRGVGRGRAGERHGLVGQPLERVGVEVAGGGDRRAQAVGPADERPHALVDRRRENVGAILQNDRIVQPGHDGLAAVQFVAPKSINA